MRGGHAHHLKGVHGADIAAKALWLALTAPQDVTDGGSNDTFKNRIALSDFQELIDGITDAVSGLVGGPDFHTHKTVHVAVRKGIQDHTVDNAVHGRRRHDAECQREYGNRAEARRFAENSHAITKVLEETLYDRFTHFGCASSYAGHATILLRSAQAVSAR